MEEMDGESKGMTAAESKSLHRVEKRSREVARFFEKLALDVQVGGHKGGVEVICYCPDGSLFATGSSDGTIKIWDSVSLRMLHSLEHGGLIVRVCFNSNGHQLASGSTKGVIKLWDSRTGRPLNVLDDHAGWITSLCFSAEGDLLASGSQGSGLFENGDIKIWDSATGRLTCRLRHGNKSNKPDGRMNISSLCFSPCGRYLVSGSFRGTHRGSNCDFHEGRVRLWSPTSGRLIHSWSHGHEVSSVCFNPKGDQVASGSADGTVRTWDVIGGRELLTLDHGAPVFWVCYSLKGSILVSADHFSYIKIWNAETGILLNSIQCGGQIESLCLSALGDSIAGGYWHGAVRCWDVSSGQLLHDLEGHHQVVESVCFNPKSRQLVSGASNGRLIIWDPVKGRLLHSSESPLKIQSVQYISRKNMLSVLSDGVAFLFDTESGRLLEHIAFRSKFGAFDIHPQGDKYVNCSNDGMVQLTEITGNKLLLDWKASNVPGYGATKFCFSPVGDLLAGTDNNYVTVWRSGSGRKIGRTPDEGLFGFNPDGSLLATCIGETVALIDMKEGFPLHRLKHEGFKRSVCFSPDGRQVASASDNGTVRLWDTNSGRLLHDMDHGGAVSSVCFNPSGDLLASGSDDNGTVKLWRTSSGQYARSIENGAKTTSLCFDSSERWLFCASDIGTVKIWDPRNWQPVAVFVILNHGEWMTCTSDGYYIGSDDVVKRVLMKWERNGDQYPADIFPRDNPNPRKVAEALASTRSGKPKPKNSPPKPKGLSGRRQALLERPK